MAVNQDLPWGFDLEFIHDLRTKDNNSTLKKSISEIELSYKVNKYLRLASGYRYSVYPDNKYSERTAVSSTVSLKTGPVSHKVRVKYQVDDDSDDPAETYLRSRYGVSTKRIFSLRPFADIEAFYSLDHDQVEKRRINLGVNRKLSKQTDLVLYYRIQDEMNVNNPEASRMLGLTFEIELK